MNDTDLNNGVVNEPSDDPQQPWWWVVVLVIGIVLTVLALVLGSEYLYRRRRSRISSVDLKGAASPDKGMVSTIRGVRSPRRRGGAQ